VFVCFCSIVGVFHPIGGSVRSSTSVTEKSWWQKGAQFYTFSFA